MQRLAVHTLSLSLSLSLVLVGHIVSCHLLIPSFVFNLVFLLVLFGLSSISFLFLLVVIVPSRPPTSHVKKLVHINTCIEEKHRNNKLRCGADAEFSLRCTNPTSFGIKKQTYELGWAKTQEKTFFNQAKPPGLGQTHMSRSRKAGQKQRKRNDNR